MKTQMTDEAKLGAVGALLFSALVVVQNAVRGATVPNGRLSDAQLLAHLQQDGWTQALYCVTFALGFVGLYLFASAVEVGARSASPRGQLWARVGTLGVTAIGVDFLVLNALLVGMFAGGEALAAQPVLLRVLWDVHMAVFAMNMTAIAVALFGLGSAAVEIGYAPRWVRPLSRLGAVLLFASALPAPQIVAGSPAVLVGVAGFLCWVVFLVASGLRMLAGARRGAWSPAPTAAPTA